MFETSNPQNTFGSLNVNNNALALNSSNQLLSTAPYGLTDSLQQPLRAASSASLPSVETASTGVFTTGATGQVTFDYLFDGGAYEGEVAIFDLTGMDRWLKAGSEFFAREAALRALSNTDLGHVVISDQTEGARFSGSISYEGDLNSGTYTGAKTFSMRPGENFGIMLVPNGKVEDVLFNRNWEANQLPLFSISLINSTQATQFTKLVDTHADALNLVDGNTFGFEDLRLDGNSDRDYNDMIFQVRGATGDATLIDKSIDPQYDWRNAGIGKKLTTYANVDGKGLTARYYDNDDFTGYRGRRTDASVDFNWGEGAPTVMTSPETFSIRWTGQVEAPSSEDYTFYIRSDEKVRLLINGQLLIDHWTSHSLAEDNGKITLKAGQKYDLKLEYAEKTGAASVQLLWSSASQFKETVPQNVLYADPVALPLDPETGLEYKPGELLVKFNPALTSEEILSEAQAYGAASVERVVPFDPQLHSSLDQWRVLTFDRGTDLPKVRDAFSSNRTIGAVELNYIGEVSSIPSPIPDASSDPSFNEQWGLRRIDAPEAWKYDTGGKAILVAVIDTGIDYNHPDLAANIWTNQAEAQGQAGVDDDHNGYIDDIHGYDFGQNDGDPIPEPKIKDKVNDFINNEYYGHGTHVAGIIGAVGNNGIGVVGVSPIANIIAIRDEEENGEISIRGQAEAIRYATKMGASVINLSQGGYTNSFFNKRDLRFDEASGKTRTAGDIVYEAVQEAGNNNVLVVAAAGNDGTDNDIRPFFPASLGGLPSNYGLTSLPNVISVAAIDQQDQLATFSNFGKHSVDLAAPGVDILSTLPNNSYGLLSGTSMAAPFVTGAAALLLAQNPFLSLKELKDALLTATDEQNSLQGKIFTEGVLIVSRAFFNVIYPPGTQIPIDNGPALHPV